MLIQLISSGAPFQDILLQLCFIMIAILVSLSFHEYMHAIVATRLGDSTPRAMGRCTMNPAKHIDPIGFAMMMLAGFGWAKPVMINSRNFKKPRRDDILVSVAGPLGNLMLSVVSYIIILVCAALGVLHPIVYNIFYNIYWFSICFMVFNLLPIPPLDGYHIFKDATIRRFSPSFFATYERYGFIILIALILISSRTNFLGSIINFVGGIMPRLLG